MKERLAPFITVLASILGWACCITPTIFILTGISIGSLSLLKALDSYRPLFLLIGYLSIGYSFYNVYFKKPKI